MVAVSAVKGITLLVAASAVAACTTMLGTACGGDERSSEPAPAPPPTTSAPVTSTSAATEEIVVDLAPLGGAGPAGEIRLSPVQGGASQIVVEIEDAEGFVPDVHPGSCLRLGSGPSYFLPRSRPEGPRHCSRRPSRSSSTAPTPSTCTRRRAIPSRAPSFHRARAVGENVLDGIEPQAFWRHFESITQIPRPPRHEERIVAHVRGWAADRGLEARADAAGNLVVSVPATPGREPAPTVVLQGHLDMVCEREPDSAYDAAEGRIGLVRDGDWLTADGTTLGADDGVAIAAMLALAEDGSFPHGPLELLMTVAEEVGLEGANALDPSLVNGIDPREPRRRGGRHPHGRLLGKRRLVAAIRAAA